MIPVLGTLIVNGINWLEKQINSIDFPVDNYLIIDNNAKGENTNNIQRLISKPHKFIKNIKLATMPYNIGIAAGWNMIIKSYVNSPFWIIANNDVSFCKGFLKEMYEKSQDEKIGLVFGNGGDFGLGSFDLFLIKDFVVQSHGFFDENFYPAYCEDADYIMKLHNSPVPTIYNLDKNYYHGDGIMGKGNDHDYYKTGMQTKRLDPELEKKLSFANEKNFEYMNEKWGKGWRNVEPYKYPFNIKELDSRVSVLDLNYYRNKYTGF